MLNSLASYLLGYPGSSAAAVPGEAAAAAPAEGETTATITAHVPSVDVRLSAVEADDDWLLVDKTDEDECAEGAPASSPAVSVPAATTAARLTLAVSTTSYHWPDSEDAAAAGLAAGPLEESWFVTPPPCFTSGSVPLETSPLENLLIEHPSMSVYHRSAAPQASATPLSSSVGASSPPKMRNPRKLNRTYAAAVSNKQAPEAETSAPPRTAAAATPIPSSPSVSPAQSASAAPSSERAATAASPSPSPAPAPSQTATAAAAVQPPPRRPNAYSPYHQQQQQIIQYRTAQKLVQRAACQQLKRDSMERTNKAREIRSSRNKRQRRSDHMNRHSGANNNRKC